MKRRIERAWPSHEGQADRRGDSLALDGNRTGGPRGRAIFFLRIFALTPKEKMELNANPILRLCGRAGGEGPAQQHSAPRQTAMTNDSTPKMPTDNNPL
jgi:hypothetical protein